MIPQWAGWLLASSIGIVAVVVFILLRKTEPLPQEETPSLPRTTLLTLLWPETERKGAVLTVNGSPCNPDTLPRGRAAGELEVAKTTGNYEVAIDRLGFEPFRWTGKLTEGNVVIIRTAWKTRDPEPAKIMPRNPRPHHPSNPLLETLTLPAALSHWRRDYLSHAPGRFWTTARRTAAARWEGSSRRDRFRRKNPSPRCAKNSNKNGPKRRSNPGRNWPPPPMRSGWGATRKTNLRSSTLCSRMRWSVRPAG